MKTLREILVAVCKEEGWGTEDENLEEALREGYTGISETEKSDHRWRVEYYIVACIPDGDKDRYFRYTSCRPDGDLDWEDSGYCFEGIDNVVEVEPYEVTSTAYRVIK